MLQAEHLWKSFGKLMGYRQKGDVPTAETWRRSERDNARVREPMGDIRQEGGGGYAIRTVEPSNYG